MVYLNWKALGDGAAAKRGLVWLYSSVAVLVVLILAPAKVSAKASSLLWLPYLLIWYYSFARKQGKLVKERYGKDYPRKPWGKPLLFAVLGLLALGFVGLASEALLWP